MAVAHPWDRFSATRKAVNVPSRTDSEPPKPTSTRSSMAVAHPWDRFSATRKAVNVPSAHSAHVDTTARVSVCTSRSQRAMSDHETTRRAACLLAHSAHVDTTARVSVCTSRSQRAMSDHETTRRAAAANRIDPAVAATPTVATSAVNAADFGRGAGVTQHTLGGKPHRSRGGGDAYCGDVGRQCGRFWTRRWSDSATDLSGKWRWITGAAAVWVGAEALGLAPVGATSYHEHDRSVREVAVDHRRGRGLGRGRSARPGPGWRHVV